jgi:Carboxypeptidase regulatory-like domain
MMPIIPIIPIIPITPHFISIKGGRMRRAVTMGVAVAISLMLLPSIVSAQGSGAAGIAGTVRDASGAVLPGVTVEAASPALIEKVRTTVTDAQGEYRIIELRPGSYSVTFTLPGFAAFKRDGLELGTNFTATVNAELRVGTIEETVTVSGQTPLVDIQNTTQQKTISKTLLDIVPTSKSTFTFVALIPAAISPTNLQDVGGNNGEASIRISVHGTKATDSKLLLDGMSYNMVNGDGNSRGFLVNPLSAQEIVIDTGGGASAEWGVGGAVINLISRDGGNMFSGSFFASGMKETMQSDNLTDDLKAQGFNSVNKSVHIYDINAFVGGPIVRNKLWFTSAHRRFGQVHRVANLYRDANLGARAFGAPAAVWRFAPDLSQPVEPTEDDQAHNIRLTWQATTKDKITMSYDWQWNKSQDNNGAFNGGTAAWEAAKAAPGSVYRCTPQQLMQATWIRPATNTFLVEAAANYLIAATVGRGPCAWYADRIPIRDTATNFLYNGGGISSFDWQYGPTQRASISYLTGAHTIKAGMSAAETNKAFKTFTDRGAFPLQYQFNNGVPTQLTQFISPLESLNSVRLNLGVFLQDSWKINRATVNLGLPYEYVNAYAPALERPATAAGRRCQLPASGLSSLLAGSPSQTGCCLRPVRRREDGDQGQPRPLCRWRLHWFFRDVPTLSRGRHQYHACLD